MWCEHSPRHAEPQSRHYETPSRHSERSEESPSVTPDKEMFRSAQHDVCAGRHGERSVAIRSGNYFFKSEDDWLDPHVALCAPQDDGFSIVHHFLRRGVDVV